MRETQWDFPILYEENWLILEFRCHAFVLTRDRALTGYLVIREKLTRDSMKARKFTMPLVREDEGLACVSGWAFGEIFTVREERRKACARRLLDAALVHLNLNLSQMAFLTPFTESGYELVKRLGLQEIVLTGS